jgi:hypothetical protein
MADNKPRRIPEHVVIRLNNNASQAMPIKQNMESSNVTARVRVRSGPGDEDLRAIVPG